MVFLVKLSSNHRGGLYSGTATGTRRLGVNPFDNNEIFINITGSGFTSFNYSALIGGWAVIGITKASGSNPIRTHIYDYDTATWNHADLAPLADGSGTVDSILLGSFDPGQFLNGIVAAYGLWAGTALADGAFTTGTGFQTSLANWYAQTPSVLWRFNQVSAADPVTDLMGSGADQSAITGTTVSADEPAGWSYALVNTVTGAATMGLGPVDLTSLGTVVVPAASSIDLGAASLSASGGVQRQGSAAIDLGALSLLGTVQEDVGPTPIQRLTDIAEALLTCLCTAAEARPRPPQHCCYRIGEEVAHDADMFTDLCCEGLAYVSVGDIYPVVDSFPEQSIVTQADQVCSFPSWAINLRAGIVRCAPVGTDTTMPTCTDWNVAALQNMYDAQSLASGVCCFKQDWLQLEPGLSVVIGPNSTTVPQGGCVERFITIQVQTTVCPSC